MTDTPTLLLPATPLYGHVAPMVTIGRFLQARGYDVTVLTGSRYRALVAKAGLRFVALTADADVSTETAIPRPATRASRVSAGREAVIDTFVLPLRAQHRAVQRALDAGRHDAVLSDTAFLGALPLALSVPPQRRIPVFGVSATPLSVVSKDCAPFGTGMQPGSSAWSRLRNGQIQWLLEHGPLAPIQTALDAALSPWGIAPGTLNYFDHVTAFDLVFHLSPPDLEYPRRGLPSTIRFVGPLQADPPTTYTRPSWWPDLHGPTPVVHVTQGTLDNVDLDKLVLPAIIGLADEPVLTVVATGGCSSSDVEQRLGRSLPANTRVASFLPYEHLLPRTDVVLTNGGFGGVQQALRHGVPLVVAGDTEEKPEVAARVAWSGAGLNLRTGRPSPAKLRRATRRVLSERPFRLHAQHVARAVARLGDPLVTIADTLDASL